MCALNCTSKVHGRVDPLCRYGRTGNCSGSPAHRCGRAPLPAKRRHGTEQWNGGQRLRATFRALARALSNVMLNAVDACKSGGTVSVRVRRTDIDGSDSVEVAVSDTGCGIPREQLMRIWDPYVTSKPGGTGLGLAIARQTVLAHDGRVAADSEVGAGTEIRFVLPVGSDNGGSNGR